MIEVNDIGEQVATAMQYDLEYDNLIMASMRGRAGQILGSGFSGGKVQLGVRTTKAVKMLGCSNLKQLIETDKLIIMITFNNLKKSYSRNVVLEINSLDIQKVKLLVL